MPFMRVKPNVLFGNVLKSMWMILAMESQRVPLRDTYEDCRMCNLVKLGFLAIARIHPNPRGGGILIMPSCALNHD